MRRIFVLSAAAAIMCLPGGAGATGGQLGADSAPLVAAPAVAAPVTALPALPAPVIQALPAPIPHVPVPVPAPLADLVEPITTPAAAPTPADDHMAELCAARAVFCEVDSSGRYTS